MVTTGRTNFYLALKPRSFSEQLRLALLQGFHLEPFAEAASRRKIRDIDLAYFIEGSVRSQNLKAFVLDLLESKSQNTFKFLDVLNMLKDKFRLGSAQFVPPDPPVKGSFQNYIFGFRIEMMIDGKNMTTKDIGIGFNKNKAKHDAARIFLRDYVLSELVEPDEADNSLWENTICFIEPSWTRRLQSILRDQQLAKNGY
jgi:hypothetical protein